MTHTIRNLILDMDGVLWHDDTPMPGLAPFFDALRRQNINFVLATNNATKTVAQYTAKFSRFAVDVEPEQVLTSSLATADYLRQTYPEGTSVYVVGEEGLRQALTNAGFHLLQLNELPPPHLTAHLVVVGLTRHFNYNELATAALLIRKGAGFIGTNPDRTLPTELGELPGAGSLLAFLEAATGQKPLIVGKPGTILFANALERLRAPASETAMVGDRLETDIAGGHAAGLRTILVLSGVTTQKMLSESDIQPDIVLQDITALAQYLEQLSQAPVT